MTSDTDGAVTPSTRVMSLALATLFSVSRR